MEVIVIEAQLDTPGVKLDKASNIFEISGKSLPENVMDFYGPILEWVEDYAKQPNEETRFVFNLEYFNTASSKMISSLFEILEVMVKAGHKVVAEWHYFEDDDDMQSAGEEFEDVMEVEMEFFPYM